MKQTIFRLTLFTIALSAVVFIGSRADAQMAPMMIPVTTTMVITKPAPGQIFGDKPVVTMGVKGKIYKFVLNDAYVDDPQQRIHWPDVWELVRQYRPNFNVTGFCGGNFPQKEAGQKPTGGG